MSARQDRIRFRRRMPWEAADLGARLIGEHPWFYGGLWLLLMLPWYLVLSVVFYDKPAWVFCLLWWSKPAFEAGILAVLAVQVFGEMPTFGRALIQGWRLIVRPRIIGDVLWRRLSLRRTVILPITVLEKVKGAQHTRRRLEIGRRNASQSGWLTVFGVHFEMILLYGILLVLGWVLLRDITPDVLPYTGSGNPVMMAERYLNLLTHEQNLLWHVCNLVYLVVLSFWQPFFVAMGFTLYVQARTESEAWDIRLTFRRLAGRLGKGAAMMAVIVLAGGLLVAPPAQAEVPPDVAQVEETRTQTVGSPPFIHVETRDRYCYKSCAQTARETPPVQNTLPMSPIPRLLYGVIGLVAALSALWLLWRWFRHAAPPARREGRPERMFGLDVREENLPAQVSASVAALFADHPRAALALLYRALLVQLMRRGELLFRDSTTEGEIVRMVAQQKPALSAVTDDITRAWVYMAYAHIAPSAGEMSALCASYAAAFENMSPEAVNA